MLRLPLLARPLLLAPLLLLGAAPSRATDTPPAAPTAPAPHLLDRIALIGASVTSGFGCEDDLHLGDALEAAILRAASVLAEGDALFFLQPGATGRAQVEKALAHKPTLVVAVDFLFWYGFGTQDAEGRPLASEEDRLSLLEKGLELLARFEVPVVVGDFPDVRDAVGRVLMPVQVPAEETRARLNARLREWAAGRERVRIVSLEGALTAMRKQEKLPLCGAEVDTVKGRRWLQDDRLHVTVDGLALLTQLIGESLRAGGADLGKDVWVCDVEAVRRRMVGD